MTQFSKDTILFRYVPKSKIELPRAANEAKLFIDSDGKLKILYFNGDVVEVGQTITNNITNETIVAYDDSVLKEQLSAITESLKTFATSESLATDIAIVTKIIDKNKADTLAELMPMIANVDMLLQKVEAAYQATDQATTQVRADVQATDDRLAQLRDIVDALATSLSRLTSDYASNFVLLNRSLDLKADKAVVAGQIATLQANMPVVIAGTENVIVDKINNTYVVSVTGADRIIERVVERIGGGGGVSKSWVLEQIQQGGVTPPTPIPLAITSFTGGGTYELGSIVNSVNLAWTYNYDPDTSQSLDQGIGSLPLIDRVYTYSTPISSNTTFTLSATDSVHGSASDTETVSFLNNRYWGVTTAATMTSADVTAGNSELVESISKDITFNCSGGRYFYYAFPSRLGSLSTINTKVNGLTFSDWSDNGGGATVSGFTLSITNSSGYTETYRVYRSYNLQNGSNIPTEMR